MHAGPLMRAARKRAALSQEELARRLGTRQSAIARWEAGAVSPRLATVERLFRACGFEPRITLVPLAEDDLDQIRERLGWSPRQRLRYLVDMVAFEQRAHRARSRPGKVGSVAS